MRRKTVLLVSNTTQSFWVYRRDLIRHFIAQGCIVHCVAADDSYRDQVCALGVTLHAIPLHRSSTNPLRELKTLLTLWWVIYGLRPDVVFTYTIKPNAYAPVFCRLRGIPCISIVTGLGYSFISNTFKARIARLVFTVGLSFSRAIWPYNEQDQNDLIRAIPWTRSKISVIPGSGIDTDFFNDLPRTPTSAAPFMFLMVSRLLIDKGVREYIQAARIVRRQFTSVTFHILGALDVHNPACITQEERDQAIQDGTLTYHPETAEVRPYIHSADCIVLPSYREGIPKVLLEAGAMSRPTITTDVPGCRDVIRDGYNGFVVPGRDASALATAMVRMIEMSQTARLEMARNARHHIVEYFSNEAVFKKYDFTLNTIFQNAGGTL